MPTLPSPDELMKSITDAASGVISKDITTIAGFAQNQEKKLATFAIWIGEAELAGEFKDDPGLRDDFLISLRDMTRDFVNTLRGLAMIIVEKLWNAIVSVIWDALDKATGLTLPRPV